MSLPRGNIGNGFSDRGDSDVILETDVPNGLRSLGASQSISNATNDSDHQSGSERFHNAQCAPSSLGGSSTVVRDAGYSLEAPDQAEGRPPEQSLDLTGLGTQFDSEGGSRPNFTLELEDLAAWIRTNRIDSAVSRHKFLPIDQLERCMTQYNIQRQLLRVTVREDLAHYTTALLKRGKESRQRIFALLCLIELSTEIGKFIRAEIFDTDLPFIFRNDGVYRQVTEGSETHEKLLLSLDTHIWRPYLCESFETHQGEISAPIFKFTWAANERVLHFPLKDELILPFMEVNETSRDGMFDTTTQFEGGTSVVRKVKIHPAHYNPPPHIVMKSDLYFAVKELKVIHPSKKPEGYKEDREALALKRVNDKSHPHLIRLLATYTYRGRFNLIFAWADGNLKEFWETRSPDLSSARRDPDIVKWMSAQILGLAKALKIIHYCEIDKANPQGLTPDELKKLHGRHGDLKPENILWSREGESTPQDEIVGVLQIGDFGFADFHSKHSKSTVRRSAVNGVTETYSAPEFDVTQQVSPQFDIWSFGCILLQFVVWYLRGWKGIEDFSKARSKDSRILMIPSDNFYSLEVGGTHGYRARAKPSVAEMFKTLKDEASSDYILDLVEYIQTKLLRVDSAKRARIKEVVHVFSRLDEYCQQAPTYCTNRTRQPGRIDSGLSEIVELPEFPTNAAAEASPSVSQSPTNGQAPTRDFKIFSHNNDEHEEKQEILANNGRARSKTRAEARGVFTPYDTANDTEYATPIAQHNVDSHSLTPVHPQRLRNSTEVVGASANQSSSMTGSGKLAPDLLPVHKGAMTTNDQSVAESHDQSQPKRSRSRMERISSVQVQGPSTQPLFVNATVQAPKDLVRAPPNSSSNPNDSLMNASSTLTTADPPRNKSRGGRASKQSKGVRAKSRRLLSKVADRLCGKKDT